MGCLPSPGASGRPPDTRQTAVCDETAEWADQGGAGTEQEVRGACDRGREGYGAVVPEVMTRSQRKRGGEGRDMDPLSIGLQ